MFYIITSLTVNYVTSTLVQFILFRQLSLICMQRRRASKRLGIISMQILLHYTKQNNIRASMFFSFILN